MALIIAVLLGATSRPAAESRPAATRPASRPAGDQTVWVLKYGSYYHVRGCELLPYRMGMPVSTPLDRSEADKTRTPCPVCLPPGPQTQPAKDSPPESFETVNRIKTELDAAEGELKAAWRIRIYHNMAGDVVDRQREQRERLVCEKAAAVHRLKRELIGAGTGLLVDPKSSALRPNSAVGDVGPLPGLARVMEVREKQAAIVWYYERSTIEQWPDTSLVYVGAGPSIELWIDGYPPASGWLEGRFAGLAGKRFVRLPGEWEILAHRQYTTSSGETRTIRHIRPATKAQSRGSSTPCP